MNGNKILFMVLNTLLANELTAVNQNMIHSDMCENWRTITEKAIQETRKKWRN